MPAQKRKGYIGALKALPHPKASFLHACEGTFDYGSCGMAKAMS
jgi:hypothetical protein